MITYNVGRLLEKASHTPRKLSNYFQLHQYRNCILTGVQFFHWHAPVQLSAQNKNTCTESVQVSVLVMKQHVALRAAEWQSDADVRTIRTVRYVAPFSGSRGALGSAYTLDYCRRAAIVGNERYECGAHPNFALVRQKHPLRVASPQNSILTSVRLAGSASKKSRFERPLLLATMLEGKETIIWLKDETLAL